MDTRTENAIAPLVDLWQARNDQLEQKIVDWSGRNLAPEKENELIAIVRNSQSATDVKAELTTFAEILTQPATN
jgi:hypothetical protein